MLRFILLLSLILPTFSHADQGLNIKCFNMKSLLLGKKEKPLKFTLEASNFQYFDEAKSQFVRVRIDQLKTGKDVFVYRMPEYELVFKIITFKGETKPGMSLTKYDYHNKKYLEHYRCDVKYEYIE